MIGNQFFDTFLQNHPRKYIRNKFSYIVGGTSKTAFLIFPGSGENDYSCYNLIDHFEKKYKAIAVNYLNLTSLNEFFEVVQTILKKEKIDSVILYGLSLGGFLAQSYIRKYGMTKALILSHTGTIRSPSIRKSVIRPLKIIAPFVRYIPPKLFKFILKRVMLRAQLRKENINDLYAQFAPLYIIKRSKEYGKRFENPLSDKAFIQSVTFLGLSMEKEELSHEALYDDSDRILIFKTDNDPLAQDDGLLNEYYPHATEHVFTITGHLTPFIQTDTYMKTIDEFLEKK
ncbi:MAG: alpha/beta hydrolase [bacterium]|nr:alpha/beta hydrolase [bacterium]